MVNSRTRWRTFLAASTLFISDRTSAIMSAIASISGSRIPRVVTAGVPFNVPGTTNILRVAPCDERLIYSTDPE